VFATSVLIASCVVLSPLDEVNTRDTDGGAGSGGDGSVSRSCTTNAECSAKNADAPFRCLNNACVALQSEDCSLVYDGKEGKDHTDANAVYLGAFANYGRTQGRGHDVYNYQLALRELSGPTVKGMPGPNGSYRPVVLVVCDNADSKPDRVDVVRRGFEHLVNTLHVPGILAALREDDLLNFFGEFGQSTDTFFLTPFGANPALAGHPDKGLLWHMLGLPSQLAPTYVALVKRLEARLKEQRPALTNIKIAVIESGSGFDDELSRQVRDGLRFNGDKTVTENRDAGHYLSQRIGAGTDLAGVVRAIEAFVPNIVLSLAGDELTDTLLPELEPKLGVYGTYFVLSPVNLGAMSNIKSVIEAAVKNADEKSHKRYLGVNVAGAEASEIYNKYFDELRNDFPDARHGTENYYDAMYFLVYALHAGLPTANAKGTDLVVGIKRLMEEGATPYAVGRDHVSNVYGSLVVSTSSIYLTGAMGPPNFDKSTGVRTSSGSVLCFEHTPDETPEITELPDVLRTNAGGELRFSGYTESTAPCLDNELDYIPLR
jgi:hypothetical protein